MHLCGVRGRQLHDSSTDRSAVDLTAIFPRGNCTMRTTITRRLARGTTILAIGTVIAISGSTPAGARPVLDPPYEPCGISCKPAPPSWWDKATTSLDQGWNELLDVLAVPGFLPNFKF